MQSSAGSFSYIDFLRTSIYYALQKWSITMKEPEEKEKWSDAFEEFRPQLLRLAKRNMAPALSLRVTAEDIVQTALLSACQRRAYFENNQDVPVYFKLRTILLQTITDMERYHLRSQKRDVFKEAEVIDSPGTQTEAMLSWNMLADSISSPTAHIRREEREELLRQAIETLAENDRIILELRHFDGLSNQECADILHIEQKAASIRYVRALQRLKEKLIVLSEFRS